MIISVASGKGGTGKTTVSAALASVWDKPVMAVDLDVEEPNLHLFLRPGMDTEESVFMEVPVLDESKCTLCRACTELCRFKAITILGSLPMVFTEMCHGCGGCMAVCPEKAIIPGSRELGVIKEGAVKGSIPYMMGELRVGEAMSPPLMREVRKRVIQRLQSDPRDVIIDAPPGVSCPAVSAVMDSDYIVLVTEPTPFGFHDFKLAWEAFSPMKKPMGAVINRAGLGDSSVQDFCREKKIPVLTKIPFDRSIAEGYSHGRIISDLNEEIRDRFLSLRDNIARDAAEVTHA